MFNTLSQLFRNTCNAVIGLQYQNHYLLLFKTGSMVLISEPGFTFSGRNMLKVHEIYVFCSELNSVQDLIIDNVFMVINDQFTLWKQKMLCLYHKTMKTTSNIYESQYFTFYNYNVHSIGESSEQHSMLPHCQLLTSSFYFHFNKSQNTM